MSGKPETQKETLAIKIPGREQQAVSQECCLVQIYGPDLGKKYALDKLEVTIGRGQKNDIVLDLVTVSRRHARLSSKGGKVYLSDVGSTNGTFVNDQEVREGVPLRSGDLIKVGGAIFKFLHGENIEAKYHDEIYRMTILDGLTQIYNKRYFLDFLDREMARCSRYGRPLSLLLFDIDHFKKINDEAGHLAGDSVLRELAGLVKQRVRKEQCLARYGGEEFAYAMPESEPEKSRRFAERLLTLVSEHKFRFDEKVIPVTISIGVAGISPEMTDPMQLIKAADANLYQAKREGRNRVCC